MKKITPIIVLLLSINARAYDTSGCNMRENSQETQTVLKNTLRVQSEIAQSSRCWNADDSAVNITYEWFQNNGETDQRVQFWTKINQVESTVAARVYCKQFDGGGNYTNYGNTYKCQAVASVKVGYQENITIEVAPKIDGSWDTKGYSQNYFFRL